MSASGFPPIILTGSEKWLTISAEKLESKTLGQLHFTGTMMTTTEPSKNIPRFQTDNMDLKASGVKYDAGKEAMDLIPPEFLFGTAEILTLGAVKYEVRNWEKGMRWGRVFASLMRHLWRWWGGENLDSETKKSHLWHASCCIAFLIAYESRQVGEDDRPFKQRSAR